MSLFRTTTQLIFHYSNSQLSTSAVTDEHLESYLIAACLFIFSFQMQVMFAQPPFGRLWSIIVAQYISGEHVPVAAIFFFIEDTYFRRAGLELTQLASLWRATITLQHWCVLICRLLHYHVNTAAPIASSNRKDLLKLLLDSQLPFQMAFNTIMLTFFHAYGNTTQNNGFNICPYLQQVFCMQMSSHFRDGKAECL